MSFFRRWSSTFSTLSPWEGDFITVPTDPSYSINTGETLIWTGTTFTDGSL